MMKSTPSTAQPSAASLSTSLPPPTYYKTIDGKYWIHHAKQITEQHEILEVLVCDMTQQEVLAVWQQAVATKANLGSIKIQGQVIYWSYSTDSIADDDVTQLAAAKAYVKASDIKNSATPIHELRRTT
ncbi:hypothetical protein LTR85_001258 [Meristemomyces frigidus]|nr:hypothetical protein LTR85_001258 [Meristemomyces frigidus]